MKLLEAKLRHKKIKRNTNFARKQKPPVVGNIRPGNNPRALLILVRSRFSEGG